MTQELRWWVARDGQPAGPWTLEEIQTACANKQISKSTLICPVGGAAWKALSDEPQLASIFPIEESADVPQAETSQVAISPAAIEQPDKKRESDTAVQESPTLLLPPSNQAHSKHQWWEYVLGFIILALGIHFGRSMMGNPKEQWKKQFQKFEIKPQKIFPNLPDSPTIPAGGPRES